ncbi:glycine betaine ABC transporter substrate-binding protein [Gracilibacillus halophilus YIM-C55.5]|uniref:Glycine betaine ABC transporter substrate-binding protein n=1 Tax=Gracilibacillus halophilus YIM-C55.5 TaxID=1308866 RepID=N4WPY8_9BACI|nr:glycine betaine ABC transporter substrate-binding protein [Gracilibacillus halophilus]ENH96515.1 glycine betaine ABC transporter substrate-binding protein [Gracilibacillus halophilus YIM-C55.5]
MKKLLLLMVSSFAMVLLVACGNEQPSTNDNEQNNEGTTNEEKGTITFGQTPWSSTAPPTQIAKQILEEQGYTVEIEKISQPMIWEGMANQEIDFFMDAWLPYTEAARWEKFKDDLTKVTTSYENAKLGWVVPSYVEENTIKDIKQNPEKYDNQVVSIAEGAGIVDLSKDLMEGFNMRESGIELSTSSEGAMISVVEEKISNQEPVLFTAWRPHSIFARHDLKFLEGQNEYFKADNVYVLSYNGIEEEYPEAYQILSNWGISIDALEDMIYKNEENGTSFEKLASQWIEEHQDKVNQMIEN